MRNPFLIAITLALPWAAAADDLDARAVALFEALQADDRCPTYAQDRPAPARRQFMVSTPTGDQQVTTFEFTCDAGAYNLVQVFLIHSERDGLRPLSFAVPLTQVDQPSDEGVWEPEAGPGITGYGTTFTLINPTVDETTGRIVTTEKWRGLGDAGTSGTWDLTPEGYVLRSYRIDATYDGQLDPVTVLDMPAADQAR